MTTRRQTSPPPRIAERMLEVCVRDHVALHGLAGDLYEQFDERMQHSPRWQCVLWYWRQSLHASVRYSLQRMSRVHKRKPGSEFPTRARKGDSSMANSYHDFRYAIRMLRKTPGIAAIAILALALGTGLPTIMFTIVNGVLRDLPVEQGDRVMHLYRTDPAAGRKITSVSHHDFADWRAQQTSFEDIAGFSSEDVTLSGADIRPLRRNGAFVTANTFDVLRVTPILGRNFSAEDESPASPLVVIISYTVWQNRFAADPDVLGQILSVDGELRAVVGVMPERFHFPFSEDLWFPLPVQLDGKRGEGPYLQVVGRLADGVSIENARAELSTIAARLAEEYPETNGGFSADAMGYTASQMGQELARGLYTMLGAVSFVLLIACANVANLLLARAVTRGREIAVRTALGAGRLRVVSQFLIEAFVITAIGGVLGTTVAFVGVRLFNQRMAPFIGVSWIDIRIDGAVLSFVVAVVVVGSLAAGVLPALQASGTNLNDVLKDESRGISSLRLGRFSRGLVIGEVALSCALLVVSGLMIKGVLSLRAIDLGMPVQEIVTGEVELPRQVYTTPESRVQFFEELERRIQNVPGVVAVAMMSDIPATGGSRWPVLVGNQPLGAELPRVGGMSVTPSFLNVLDAPIIDGRGFREQDRIGTEPVVLINESFAHRCFPDQRPVGRTIRIGRNATDQPPRTIVGVVPDLFAGGIAEEDGNGPGIYLPLAQNAHVSMQVMVRAVDGADPVALTSQIRAAIESLDRTLALMDVDRVDRIIARGTLVFEVFGKLFLFFGLAALFLASIGLYGVMAFTVSQRTREWGVRMALGAQGSDVVLLVLKQGLKQLIVGLAAGLVIAAALSVPMADIFYQVEPWDGSIFAIIAVILTATGLLAIFLPARRATQVDPLEALRYE